MHSKFDPLFFLFSKATVSKHEQLRSGHENHPIQLVAEYEQQLFSSWPLDGGVMENRFNRVVATQRIVIVVAELVPIKIAIAFEAVNVHPFHHQSLVHTESQPVIVFDQFELYVIVCIRAYLKGLPIWNEERLILKCFHPFSIDDLEFNASIQFFAFEIDVFCCQVSRRLDVEASIDEILVKLKIETSDENIEHLRSRIEIDAFQFSIQFERTVAAEELIVGEDQINTVLGVIVWVDGLV